MKRADWKCKMESMDSRIPKKPKKVSWIDKHCVLCKKHGGSHKSHSTRDRRHIIKTILASKRMGAQVCPMKEKESKGVNFAQVFHRTST
jgi:hypothetical protein